MKRLIIAFVVCLFSVYSYSQEYVKFNGATFGKPLNEFVKQFPGNPYSYYNGIPRGYNSEICNHNCYFITLNSKRWRCHIFSSRTTNTVFRTVCVSNLFYNDLESQLMLLVKALEEKYGGAVQEKQENLGEVVHEAKYYREMLALYYYIKGSNGNRIGEIRISAAPTDRNAKTGYIELSYTDYKSSEKATKEYNSIMRNAL